MFKGVVPLEIKIISHLLTFMSFQRLSFIKHTKKEFFEEYPGRFFQNNETSMDS